MSDDLKIGDRVIVEDSKATVLDLKYNANGVIEDVKVVFDNGPIRLWFPPGMVRPA